MSKSNKPLLRMKPDPPPAPPPTQGSVAVTTDFTIRYFNSAKLGYRTAWFSQCEQYRYGLKIVWDFSKPCLVVIGLNPSKATEREDDPTIRRCKDFAMRWGYGGLLMLNLAAFRATDPAVMLKAADPIGPKNRIEDLIGRAGAGAPAAWPGTARVLAAWGKNASDLGTWASEVVTGFRERGIELVCLGLNSDGSPKHPLYVNANTKPAAFGERGEPPPARKFRLQE